MVRKLYIIVSRGYALGFHNEFEIWDHSWGVTNNTDALFVRPHGFLLRNPSVIPQRAKVWCIETCYSWYLILVQDVKFSWQMLREIQMIWAQIRLHFTFRWLLELCWMLKVFFVLCWTYRDEYRSLGYLFSMSHMPRSMESNLSCILSGIMITPVGSYISILPVE